MSLDIYCRTRLTKINCKENWYPVGKMTFLIKLVFLSETLEFMALELHLKSSTGRSYSNKSNTEAICEWRLNCGKYVMNRTDLQLVCYSTVCNQYIAYMNYPYKHFVSFSLLYIGHKYLVAVLLLLVFQWGILSRFSDTGITVTSQW